MQSAAFKSYTKGGENVFNPTSEEGSESDSLPGTDDKKLSKQKVKYDKKLSNK